MPLASLSRKRLTTIFGWIAGVATGLLLAFLISFGTGESPRANAWSTFALVVIGGFGGTHLADRLGDRGFRVLGIAAGVLVAVVTTLLVATLFSLSAS